jgi:hypothetical protein
MVTIVIMVKIVKLWKMQNVDNYSETRKRGKIVSKLGFVIVLIKFQYFINKLAEICANSINKK